LECAGLASREVTLPASGSSLGNGRGAGGELAGADREDFHSGEELLETAEVVDVGRVDDIPTSSGGSHDDRIDRQ
jgi:hypothetical protein